MPSNDPSTPPSWPAEDKRRPLARPDRSSECLSALEQTDTGDPGSPPLPPGPAEWQEAKGGLTPLYLIQNVILEQTLGVSPTAPFLAWSNQRPLESAYSSAAHLLLFQEPTASLKPMVPSQKPSAKEIRFPTLGTYPRIAPHPGRQPEEAPSPAAEPIRHKRLYVGEAWAPPEAPTGKDSWEKSPKGLPTSLQTAALVCPQASAHPPLPCAGCRAAVKGARRPGEHSLVRQRRLHNTVEILRRSGLLGITLRTKELLRQNSRAQRELAQLREEAQLLCQAVQSSDWQAWARLQGAIGHSAAPCLPSKGAGTETHLGQQPNLATQPPGLDTPLPMALPQLPPPPPPELTSGPGQRPAPLSPKELPAAPRPCPALPCHRSLVSGRAGFSGAPRSETEGKESVWEAPVVLGIVCVSCEPLSAEFRQSEAGDPPKGVTV